MFYIFVLLFCAFQTPAIGDKCIKLQCSNVFDIVCGLVEPWRGVQIYGIYQNVCHLERMRCRYGSRMDIQQVPDFLCGMRQHPKIARRVYDFSIVGAHEPCNHTCPTHCADIYEPACAQIWKSDMSSFSYRPMINHCHIDLFSCALGVNVTIQPLGKCYKNPSGLLFMSHVAALKSLRLLDETHIEDTIDYKFKPILRRFNPYDLNFDTFYRH